MGITGLWFEGQKYFGNTLPDKHIPQETEILTEAKKWLDVYFSGEEPKFTPPLHPDGSTFRQAVWQILLQIPYGPVSYTHLFPEQFEAYYKDHVPFKNDLVKFCNFIDTEVFRNTKIGDVVIGEDNWLFYLPEREGENALSLIHI